MLDIIQGAARAIFGDRGLTGTVMDVLKDTGVVKDREQEERVATRIMEYEKTVLTNEAAVIAQINTTMQAEAKSEKWPQYSWRPFIGFSFGVQTFMLGIGYSALVGRIAFGYALPDGSIGQLEKLMEAMFPLWMAQGGILGVAAGFRGYMKARQVKNG